QNYPNPFNPSTRIKFDVPKASNIKLAVYDALGKEVQTLVNGNLSPGIYEYTFNARGLTSGVYFYRLISDNMVMGINKMLLIK
ncbi:MAG TPA: T9SS type A sorting domain-containing protein, partial [Ignavibacteria bacterium]|nr:T9SS type A sorting domain-containing protein [Ignavibacteria bacterium]